MYSYEIREIMDRHSSRIPFYIYQEILQTSPQIDHIKYVSYGDYFEWWSTDGYYWKIQTYNEELNND